MSNLTSQEVGSFQQPVSIPQGPSHTGHTWYTVVVPGGTLGHTSYKEHRYISTPGSNPTYPRICSSFGSSSLLLLRHAMALHIRTYNHGSYSHCTLNGAIHSNEDRILLNWRLWPCCDFSAKEKSLTWSTCTVKPFINPLLEKVGVYLYIHAEWNKRVERWKYMLAWMQMCICMQLCELARRQATL